MEQNYLNNDSSQGPTRRRFFVGAIYGLTALISSILGGHALLYLLIPARIRVEQEWVEVGDISKLAPGAPAEMTFRRNRVDGWKVISEKTTVWVTRSQNNQVTAFAPQCTHLGCAYHWEENKNEFVCPCHNSIFSIDGSVVDGPATRSLDRYDTKLQGDKLLVGRLRQSSEGRV